MTIVKTSDYDELKATNMRLRRYNDDLGRENEVLRQHKTELWSDLEQVTQQLSAVRRPPRRNPQSALAPALPNVTATASVPEARTEEVPGLRRRIAELEAQLKLY